MEYNIFGAIFLDLSWVIWCIILNRFAAFLEPPAVGAFSWVGCWPVSFSQTWLGNPRVVPVFDATDATWSCLAQNLVPCEVGQRLSAPNGWINCCQRSVKRQPQLVLGWHWGCSFHAVLDILLVLSTPPNNAGPSRPRWSNHTIEPHLKMNSWMGSTDFSTAIKFSYGWQCWQHGGYIWMILNIINKWWIQRSLPCPMSADGGCMPMFGIVLPMAMGSSDCQSRTVLDPWNLEFPLVIQQFAKWKQG